MKPEALAPNVSGVINLYVKNLFEEIEQKMWLAKMKEKVEKHTCHINDKINES